MSKKIQIFLFAFTLMFGAQNAHAQCTSPASNEGGIDYSTTINDLIVCDGTNWQTAGYTGGGSGLFTDNTTHITRSDFHIINSGQTSTTAALDGDGTRMFYDPNKGALRGGSITSGNDRWQNSNIGSESFAWGWNVEASGNSSTAIGRSVIATGFNSMAFGNDIQVGTGTAQTVDTNAGEGNYSIAYGLGDASTSTKPRVTGNETAAFFFGDQQGENITATNVLALEGGSLLLSNDSGTACAANKQGALRLNTTADGLEMCDGAGTWTSTFTGGGAGGGAIAINDLTDAYTDYTTDFNLFMGQNAGSSIAAGAANNIAIGINSASNLTTGGDNIAIGNNAMASTTTGGGNTIIGHDSMTTGNGFANTALGVRTLKLSTGALNTAIGDSALESSTTASGNTALGFHAARLIDSGANVSIGVRTMYKMTTGSDNVAIGAYNFSNAITGSDNTILGSRSGNNLTSGDGNILIGKEVQTSTATSNEELNIGDLIKGDIGTTSTDPRIGAPKYCDENLANCFIATDVSGGIGSRIQDADNDTYIDVDGTGDGSENTIRMGFGGTDRLVLNGPNATLSARLFLQTTNGFSAVFKATSPGSGPFLLFQHSGIDVESGILGFPREAGAGDSAFAVSTGNNGVLAEHLRVTSDGDVGIGTLTPTESLHVNGNVLADAYFHTSDKNLKNDIELVKGLDLINKLRGVTFTFKEDNRESAGIIAQDVQKVLPRAVKENTGGFLTVDYNQLFAPIIEAIKDLHKMVMDLTKNIQSIFDKVSALESENANLKNEVHILKKQNQDIMKRLDALETLPQTSSSDITAQGAT